MEGEWGGLCSEKTKDFCFFCYYRKAIGDITSPVEKLKSHTRILLETEKRDIDTTARTLQHIYDTKYKCDVKWVTPYLPTPVSGPIWTINAIKRHIMSSEDFSVAFRVCMTKKMKGTMSLMETVEIDPLTNKKKVDKASTKVFTDTLKTYMAWEQHCRSMLDNEYHVTAKKRRYE